MPKHEAAPGDPLEAAIRDIAAMRVRGAHAIGRTAAEALAAHIGSGQGGVDELTLRTREAADRLVSTRPTAVTLRHGVDRVLTATSAARTPAEFRAAARDAAARLAADMEESRRRLVTTCARQLAAMDSVLTHCHSTTVVDVLAAAHALGARPRVFVTETRPFGQGLLTAKALRALDIDVTFLVDAATWHLVQSKDIDLVLVGADTVCGDGSLVNKIGTAQTALAAAETGVPFHAAATRFKFTDALPDDVQVEERPSDEVAAPGALPSGTRVWNPVFDVTPAKWITSYWTEHGPLPPAKAVERALEVLV